MSKPWFVYLLRCQDKSLYCGITTDLVERLTAHNSGKGAKYIVPSRRPAILVYQECFNTKGEALSREAAIKKLSKSAKEALIINRNFLSVAEVINTNRDGEKLDGKTKQEEN